MAMRVTQDKPSSQSYCSLMRLTRDSRMMVRRMSTSTPERTPSNPVSRLGPGSNHQRWETAPGVQV